MLLWESAYRNINSTGYNTDRFKEVKQKLKARYTSNWSWMGSVCTAEIQSELITVVNKEVNLPWIFKTAGIMWDTTEKKSEETTINWVKLMKSPLVEIIRVLCPWEFRCQRHAGKCLLWFLKHLVYVGQIAEAFSSCSWIPGLTGCMWVFLRTSVLLYPWALVSVVSKGLDKNDNKQEARATRIIYEWFLLAHSDLARSKFVCNII